MTKPIYDPIEFISKVEIFTIAIIASFITLKLLNAIYENIYEPFINILVDDNQTDTYFIKIGDYYIQADIIIKEFIKWFLLILLLMIIYNFLRNYVKLKKN